MWKMLFFLWLVPISLSVFVIARAANGGRRIGGEELKLVFGSARPARLPTWVWLGFAALGVGFFILGVVQAVILLNLAMVWSILAALFTGALAVLLLGLLFRGGTIQRTRPRRRVPSSSRAEAHAGNSLPADF